MISSLNYCSSSIFFACKFECDDAQCVIAYASNKEKEKKSKIMFFDLEMLDLIHGL